ncbi:MAG: LCP family protein [Actinobacteria bacterium]|nr:LCP family protein [Actinomycetota bacterium]
MIKRIAGVLALIALVCVLVPVFGSGPEPAAASLVMGRVHEEFQPTDGKIFVLVIGSDARFGNPERSRADAIHIVGINTKKMRGGILNFPRDSWVNVPGFGSSKMNEALYDGGPALLARTLEGVTGIRIDYWLLTAFEGFEGIVRDLGGVEMTIPQRVDDNWSGAHLPAGKQKLRHWEALAYLRSRHAFAGGDVARTTHHGDFLLAMLRKLRDEVGKDPTQLLNWIATTRRHTKLNVPASEQFRLGVLASKVSPKDVRNVTVPVQIGAVGAASVVFIQPSANDIYKRFRENGYL